jgi:hypothetical protein
MEGGPSEAGLDLPGLGDVTVDGADLDEAGLEDGGFISLKKSVIRFLPIISSLEN